MGVEIYASLRLHQIEKLPWNLVQTLISFQSEYFPLRDVHEDGQVFVVIEQAPDRVSVGVELQKVLLVCHTAGPDDEVQQNLLYG